MTDDDRGGVLPTADIFFPLAFTGVPRAAEGGGGGFPVDGQRGQVRAQQHAIAKVVADVMAAHTGHALMVSQIYEEAANRLDFIPGEADLRSSLRHLVRTDERCVKVGREAYAWTVDGVIPPPPAPDRVADMIDRRWRGETLDEIGAAHGLTRERIRQLLTKYGGPSAEEVRDRRSAEALVARVDREERVAAAVGRALQLRGPMTVAEVVEATGVKASDVSKFWPQEFAHLRLHAAGSHESQWSDDAILDAIREAALYEFPLTANAYAELVVQGQVKGPSMPRIWQRFRSWTAACEAAGVMAGQTLRPHYESRWSDEDLIQIVRRYLLDRDSPNSAHHFDDWKRAFAPDGPSFQTLRKRFGSWTEVKRRALAQRDVAG